MYEHGHHESIQPHHLSPRQSDANSSSSHSPLVSEWAELSSTKARLYERERSLLRQEDERLIKGSAMSERQRIIEARELLVGNKERQQLTADEEEKGRRAAFDEKLAELTTIESQVRNVKHVYAMSKEACAAARTAFGEKVTEMVNAKQGVIDEVLEYKRLTNESFKSHKATLEALTKERERADTTEDKLRKEVAARIVAERKAQISREELDGIRTTGADALNSLERAASSYATVQETAKSIVARTAEGNRIATLRLDSLSLVATRLIGQNDQQALKYADAESALNRAVEVERSAKDAVRLERDAVLGEAETVSREKREEREARKLAEARLASEREIAKNLQAGLESVAIQAKDTLLSRTSRPLASILLASSAATSSQKRQSETPDLDDAVSKRQRSVEPNDAVLRKVIGGSDPGWPKEPSDFEEAVKDKIGDDPTPGTISGAFESLPKLAGVERVQHVWRWAWFRAYTRGLIAMEARPNRIEAAAKCTRKARLNYATFLAESRKKTMGSSTSTVSTA